MQKDVYTLTLEKIIKEIAKEIGEEKWYQIVNSQDWQSEELKEEFLKAIK